MVKQCDNIIENCEEINLLGVVRDQTFLEWEPKPIALGDGWPKSAPKSKIQIEDDECPPATKVTFVC